MQNLREWAAGAVARHDDEMKLEDQVSAEERDSINREIASLLPLGDKSPDSEHRLSDLMRATEDWDEPITSDKILKMVAAIEKAKRSAAQHEILNWAIEDRRREANASGAISCFARLLEQSQRESLSRSIFVLNRSRDAAKDLRGIAKEFPQFFSEQDGVMSVTGHDPTADAEALQIDELRAKVKHVDETLRKAPASIKVLLKHAPDAQPVAWAMFRDFRLRERDRLANQLVELGGDVPELPDFSFDDVEPES